MNKINISEVEVGDVFNEISHYQALSKTSTGIVMKHLESGKEVTLNNNYVTDLLQTADQYQIEKKVGRENKYWTAKQIDDAKKKGEDVFNIKVNDLKQLGIKSLFEEIYNSQVFTICFKKKDIVLSTKKIEELREAQIKSALEEIEKTSKQKKGVLEKAKEILIQVQQNPIHEVVEGEERVLRGYKTQFKSEDGFYSVIDMDITDKNNSRLVNINSIKWMVVGGIKYSVE